MATKEQMIQEHEAKVAELEAQIVKLKGTLNGEAPKEKDNTVLRTRAWISFEAYQPPSWKNGKAEHHCGMDMIIHTAGGKTIRVLGFEVLTLPTKRGEWTKLEAPQYRKKDGTYRSYFLMPNDVKDVIVGKAMAIVAKGKLPPCPFDKAANARKAERLEGEGTPVQGALPGLEL